MNRKLIRLSGSSLLNRGIATAGLLIGTTAVLQAAPTIDGSINPGSEGWTLFDEHTTAAPFNDGSGSVGSSDSSGESSSFNWYDDTAGVNRQFVQDNRGDVINIYHTSDQNNLYLAVAGPTAPFNNFDDGTLGLIEPELDDDQGDLFIAIDVDSIASGSLNAVDGHRSFNGVRAVDFLGWAPDYVLGVQFVDNGGGGGGAANIERLSDHFVVAGEGQGQNNGGFEWNADINTAATYDSFNAVSGEYEFTIPWADLGLSPGGPAPGEAIRMAMYTTQSFQDYDAYDSGPGLGNSGPFEQIGDNPGDPDTGGLLGGTDPGSFGQPGSNLITDFSLSPSHDDGVDTIDEYFEIVVVPIPEPGTAALMAAGLLALLGVRRRRKA